MQVFTLLDRNCFIENPVQYGSAPFAVTYFFFVTLNLFVAVVLEGFAVSAIGDEEQICDLALSVWKKYDTNLDFELPVQKVHSFLSDVEYAFSLDRNWGPVHPETRKVIKPARG